MFSILYEISMGKSFILRTIKIENAAVEKEGEDHL